MVARVARYCSKLSTLGLFRKNVWLNPIPPMQMSSSTGFTPRTSPPWRMKMFNIVQVGAQPRNDHAIHRRKRIAHHDNIAVTTYAILEVSVNVGFVDLYSIARTHIWIMLSPSSVQHIQIGHARQGSRTKHSASIIGQTAKVVLARFRSCSRVHTILRSPASR